MTDTKKIGRPRNFDYDAALLKAMAVFWAKGFDGASLRDLTKAMGITGPSMYAAFGDKRELYLKTIDRYADVDGCAPVVAFEAEPDIRKAVRGFLEEVILYATENDSGAKGCFLASSVSTNIGQVEGVAERVEKAIEDTDKRLAARFDKEIEKGTLPPDFPSLDRAALLYDMRQGYMFRGRAGWRAEVLLQGLDDRVEMILAHKELRT
ncbi:TetR/AcrR family transcriptional regulator [Fontisubflavum oceani]|uniref:TetR/AcrR family transcriptional regulator n=1 Tax=Fontisubflavum oceani TaxID=2978973 RepID=UPI0025B57AFA|nr:TetR/AcrR family transcriptional regulator [Fontisubflavum oceani]WJY21776.1 TetR/AcrR family transcriptional regulator [Fontisubflavum oceani]